jgi:crotonobetainyl-CoA:carnitine CoA-transferase CaiB-like acyl-CoA transferase
MTTPTRVLEIGHEVRTAYCGYLLARLGARVTKLVTSYPTGDSPAHDRAAATFLDRGKDVIRAGQTPADDLVDDTEVVIAPGRQALLAVTGSTPADLRRHRPDLVVGIASGFGEHGGYAGLAGGEAQQLALGGLLSMVGEPGREPLRLGGPQAGHAAALALFTAVQLALYRRAGTGTGALVETSAVRAVAYLDWKSQIHHADDGTVLQRGSGSGPVVLRCVDGFVGFYYRDEEWPAVKRLVGDPRLDDERFATQRGRDRHRADLVAILEAYSRHLTRDELYHRAQALHIPAGSVLTLDELRHDPQLTARDFLRTEDGVTYPLAPWTVDGIREDS